MANSLLDNNNKKREIDLESDSLLSFFPATCQVGIKSCSDMMAKIERKKKEARKEMDRMIGLGREL